MAAAGRPLPLPLGACSDGSAVDDASTSGGVRLAAVTEETADDWARLDATAQAMLVARGDVSRGALVEAAIDRIDARLGVVPIRL